MAAVAETSCVTNATDCDDDNTLFVLESYTQRIIIASCFCVVTLVGTVGNGLVILAVLLSHKLRSPTNWFVVNLGFADLITCLFLPFNVVAMLSKDGWPIVEWTCAMTGAISLTCVGASMITLALIAYNRLILLTKPRCHFYRLYTKRNICLMVSLSWIYPFLLVVIPHLAGLGKLGYSYNYKTCQQDTTLPTSDYYSLFAGAGVIIPVFIIIVVIYVLIYRFVARHNSTMQRALEGRVKSSSGTQGNARTSSDMSTSATELQDHERNVDPPYTTPSLMETKTNTPSAIQYLTTGETSESGGYINTALDNIDIENQSGVNSGLENQNFDSRNCNLVDQDENKNHSPIQTNQIHAVQGIEQEGVELSLQSRPALSNSGQTTSSKEIVKGAPKVSRHHITVTKRLSLVVLAFFFCYIPFGICVVVPYSDPAVPWTNLLTMANSCINPILYAWTMPLFREVMGCIARCHYQNIPEPVEIVRSCRRL